MRWGTASEERARAALEPADAVVGVALLVAFVLLVQRTRGMFFIADDWQLAGRGGSPVDFLRDYNGHLSILYIAVYKAVFELFGLHHPVVLRTLTQLTFLAVPAAVHLAARSRVGPVLAGAAAIVVLCVPGTSLEDPTINFWMATVGTVLVAWAMVQEDRRHDATVAVGLVLALTTGGAGTIAAAAASAHVVLVRPRLRRALAVLVPTAAWFVWWLVEGRNGTHLSPFLQYDLGQQVRATWDGVLGSFDGLVLGSRAGGLAALAGTVALLGWRLRSDRAGAANQLAWTAALLFWWFGLAVSRGALLSPDVFRYRFIGVVAIVLGLLPARPLRSPLPLPAWVGAPLLVALALALGAHAWPDVVRSTDQQREDSSRAKQLLMALQLEPPVVDVANYRIGFVASAADFQRAVDRYGSPFVVSRATIDGQLVRAGIPKSFSERRSTAPCRPTAREVRARPNDHRRIAAGDRPVHVRVRRFGDRFVPLVTVPPHRAVVLRLYDAGAEEPWVLDAPGACRRRS